MRPWPAIGVVLFTGILWTRELTAVTTDPGAMTENELFMILSDPKGPEMTMFNLSDVDLVRLLDALYRNLDTAQPAPAAISWYELGVEESFLRDL
jgi:hypothetical protein